MIQYMMSWMFKSNRLNFALRFNSVSIGPNLLRRLLDELKYGLEKPITIIQRASRHMRRKVANGKSSCN
jgi:hypothetical protein